MRLDRRHGRKKQITDRESGYGEGKRGVEGGIEVSWRGAGKGVLYNL